ncbi:MAG: glycosyltransferase family 2 protein [Solirubrobacteraceae bacterium]|nr:glycosyltransferase family 2 protein [Solirubrobacteraceae bacterium]
MITNDEAPSVSVVVVAYGSEDVIGDAILSVPAGVQVVVVEQSLSGRSAALVKTLARDDLEVINSGANRGFGAGCNLGAAQASGEVIVFLNPDARFTSGALEALVRATERGTWVAGPRIINGDGTPATRPRQWSSMTRDVWNLLLPRAITPTRLLRELPESSDVAVFGGPADLVQGSCFAVGREAFFAAGGFDERFFLYGEEEWLARRLAALGVRERVAVESVVAHVGATSTEKVGAFATVQMFRSWALLYRDRYGRVGGAGASFVLGLALVVLLASTPLRRAFDYRLESDAAWCRTAMKGLAHGVIGLSVIPPAERLAGDQRWPTLGADR